MKQSLDRGLYGSVKHFIPIVVVVFLVFMAFSGTVLGEEKLEYYGIEDTINDDLSVSNVITLRFKEPINHLDYKLNFGISNLEARSTFQSADCSIEEGNTISCDFVGMTAEKNQLTLSFDTTGGVKKVADIFQLNVNYGFLPTERTFVLIRLPETAVLSEDVANMSYLPRDGGILSDGKRIMVFWEMENLGDENLQFSVSYRLPSDIPDFIIITLTVLVVIVMVGVIIYAKKKQHTVEVLSSVLNSDEKVLVDILKREGGKALQKVLVKDSDFSKAKVSRIVKDLKSRGIVDTEPVSGRENRIVLVIGRGKPNKPEAPQKADETSDNKPEESN